MLEPGLFTLITGTSGVSALIGDRLYPVQGPPDNPAYPYVVYQAVAGSSEYSIEPTELRTKRIQFDVWSTTYLLGLQVLTALRNVLSGYSGTLTDGTRVLISKRLNEMDNFDNSAKSYRMICEYEFLFVEP